MEKGGGSRLLQMQARFQQKQLQERELKIASLYEAQQARALDRVRHSPSNGVGTSPPQPAVTQQPGKVRQMFEERRTKGIDKSYPLQPIQNTERTPPRKILPNGYTKVSTTSRTTVEKKTSNTKSHTSISSHSVRKQNGTVHVQKLDNMINGSGDLNHNHEIDLNTARVPQSNGEIISEKDEPDNVENANNYLLEEETFPEALALSPTPRSPEPHVEDKQPQRRTPVTRPKSPVKSKPKATSSSPTRRVVNENKVSERENNKPKRAMQQTTNSVLRKNPVVSPQSSGSNRARVAASSEVASSEGGCAVCGRHFAPDRLPRHQEICKKTHSKKRKPFDVLKHRLAGTEAEPLIGKLRKSSTNPSKSKVQEKPTTNSNWRKKHEEFIQAIRAAKQVQAHIKSGGKLSDLPPPPPSENPDYVSCPHCKRRFNRSAADRHIPKCATYQFNKPKQPPRRR